MTTVRLSENAPALKRGAVEKSDRVTTSPVAVYPLTATSKDEAPFPPPVPKPVASKVNVAEDSQSCPSLTRGVSKSKQKGVHGRDFSESRYLA